MNLLRVLAIAAACLAADTANAAWRTEIVVPGSPMHGVHGLAFGPDGALYACSLTGHSIYRVEIATGAVTTHVGPPRGSCDDLVFTTDGTLMWTAGSLGAVYARGTDERIAPVLGETPGLNAINATKDGRVFVTRIFAGDGLYELDAAGVKPPRAIAEGIGGLNAFAFANDGTIIGPLFFKGKVVRINTATGAMSDVATGFMQPSAVRLDAQGRVLVLDYTTGELMRLAPDGKSRQLLATVPPPADNFAIAPSGLIYVSSSAFNGITEVNPETGATRRVTWGALSAPGAARAVMIDGREHILLADSWGPRVYDPANGSVTPIERGAGVAGATSLSVDGARYLFSNVWPFGVVQVVERASGKLLNSLPGFAAPYDIKPVSDGFIVAEFGGDRIFHIANDATLTRRQAAWGLEGPVGLAAAGGDVFYVTEYGKKDRRGAYNNGDISRVDVSSNTRTVVARGLKRPEGIVLAPDGRLIVAETGARRVVAIDPTGKRKLEVLAENLGIGLEVGDQAPAPFLFTGVAATKDGAVYVTGDVDNVLYKISKR